MKREIKFRGIYPHSGKWFFGSFVNSFPDTPRIVSEGFSTPVKIETLGQFTGLKDKNGLEIYEGDIIKDGTGRVLTIQWSPKFASFCLNSKDWTFLHYFGEACDANDAEVIGNVHEHKHLLK